MIQASDSNELDDKNERICWICLSSDVDFGPGNFWSKPCRCRGALKWVHQACLQRWVSEQQHSRGESAPISCRICGTEYQIVYPPAGVVYRILHAVDDFTRSLSLVLTGGLIFGSFYWAAVTYGAVTVMQVCGHRQGLRAMQHTDPPLLLLGLPTIPVCLILAKTIPWDTVLLNLWRNTISRWPIINRLQIRDTPLWPTEDQQLESTAETSDIPRLICGALALPTIATFTGRMLFRRVQSDIRRVALGGITFLTVKGFLSIYYRELKYLRICYRQIKDFED